MIQFYHKISLVENRGELVYHKLMKKVLIIDAPPLFREFLKEKLTAEKIEVEMAQGDRDAFTKLLSIMPDLLIVNSPDDFDSLLDFLDKKKADPNAHRVPVILTGPVLEKEQLAKLPSYYVIKYFNKPVKFDIFFESIGRILRTNFSIDTTPCILELHLNDNIIFVEVAQGLNREKLALLKYRITEMIDDNKLSIPKLVLMMTDLSLSFVDGANLEYLLDNIIADPRIARKNVKVLSLDSFTKELIKGHEQYDGIEVVENLSSILNSLVDSGTANNVADVISDKILTATEDASEGSVQMKFHSELGVMEEQENILDKKITVAVVDDDALTSKLLKSSFVNMGVEVECFASGTEFLGQTNRKIYDLIILDIFMPGLSGFDIMNHLHSRKYPSPVIIYSNITNRNTIVQALSMGAKTFLIKPQKPEVIIKKSFEILNSDYK